MNYEKHNKQLKTYKGHPVNLILKQLPMFWLSLSLRYIWS